MKCLNLVIFGETGVGKSSIINLLVGSRPAATTSDARGCTFQAKSYEVQIDDTPYVIWDTAGLDEGTHGTVSAEAAEGQLQRLLVGLRRNNTKCLLVYCFRASRISAALVRNYKLVYITMCGKAVPIVAVVTGLERYDGPLDRWWSANETHLAAFNMHFNGHACVTTLNDDARYNESRQAVLSLITNTCAREHSGLVHNMRNPIAMPDIFSVPIVALCILPEHSVVPNLPLTDGCPFEGGRLMDAGGSPILVYHIRTENIRAGNQFKKKIARREADALIVCTSVNSDQAAARRAAACFYESYGGGERRLMLIVVRGAPSDKSALEWWNRVEERGSGPGHANAHKHDRYWSGSQNIRPTVHALPSPMTRSYDRQAMTPLQRAIQDISMLQPADVRNRGCFDMLCCLGSRSPKLYSAGTEARIISPAEDYFMNANVWAPWPSQ